MILGQTPVNEIIIEPFTTNSKKDICNTVLNDN